MEVLKSLRNGICRVEGPQKVIFPTWLLPPPRVEGGADCAVRNERVFPVMVFYSHPVPPGWPGMWSLYLTLQFTPTVPNLSLSERRLMTGEAWPCSRLGGFQELGSRGCAADWSQGSILEKERFPTPTPGPLAWSHRFSFASSATITLIYCL